MSFKNRNGDLGLNIGAGILGWPPTERESGRYGLVTLWTEPVNSVVAINYVPEKRIVLNVFKVKGKQIYCDLFAMILEEREFKNAGDPHRGFHPTRVDVGTEVKLGRGLLWYGDDKSVGVCPVPYTEDSNWMNPKELYKVVDQFVHLYFVPNPV